MMAIKHVAAAAAIACGMLHVFIFFFKAQPTTRKKAKVLTQQCGRKIDCFFQLTQEIFAKKKKINKKLKRKPKQMQNSFENCLKFLKNSWQILQQFFF